MSNIPRPPHDHNEAPRMREQKAATAQFILAGLARSAYTLFTHNSTSIQQEKDGIRVTVTIEDISSETHRPLPRKNTHDS